jgi:sugar phosphate isomerase/epimerase
MKTGVGSYTWTWAVGIKGYMPDRPLDCLGLVAKAKACGAGVLQIADNPSLHLLDAEEIRRTADAARGAGIELEAGTRGIEPAHLMAYLDIAKLMGSRIVRTITREIDDGAVSRMKEVLPSYEREGVVIALENHDEHKTAALADFIDRCGSGTLGVCLDTVNSFAALEPPEVVVRTLAPCTVNLHVKDFDVVRVGHQLGFSIEGKPAGKGRLDIPWTIEYLKSKGRDPNAILELWTPYAGTVELTIAREDEWAAESMRYLREIIH